MSGFQPTEPTTQPTGKVSLGARRCVPTPKAERLESDRKQSVAPDIHDGDFCAGPEDKALAQALHRVDERCRSELGCIGAPGDATRDRILDHS